MYHTGFLIEFILHFLLLSCQCLYALLLALYSFYVIFQQEGYQDIFMNATALLLLNELDDYVCSILKLLVDKEHDTLFIVVPTSSQTCSNIDFRELYFYWMPKIYAIICTAYSLIYIKNHLLHSYIDRIPVDEFVSLCIRLYVTLYILAIIATLIFVIISIPLYLKCVKITDKDSFGKGFETLDYDEVVHFKNTNQKAPKQ